MPPIEEVDLHQKAVLWPKGRDDRHGQPKVGEPVSVDVRWDSKRRQMLSPQGTPIGVDATVVINQEVEPGSTMWLAPDASYSAVDQWYGTGSAGVDSGVMEVVAYSETPDVKARVVRRTLGMVFYKDTPPEQQ